MRTALLAFAAVLAAAGAALADPTARTESTTAAPAAASTATGARQLYVCDAAGETDRSWVLEHGGMAFVSGGDLARAVANKETWATPRCITAAELQWFEKSHQAVKVVRIAD